MVISENGYLYKTSLTHISNITGGDTIIHDKQMRTVSKTNIKNDPFMGRSLFGDSYHSGNTLVNKVTFVLKQS